MTREEAINHLEDLHVFRHEPTETDREALGMAIEALKEQKWIPVSERLPKNYKEVLVQWERTNGAKNIVTVCISTGLIDEHGEWCNAYGLVLFNQKIIAWQPLPEPYKAGERHD